MKKLQRWLLSGALVALVAFAIHGCGGDDDKNPANPGGGGGTGTPDVVITINGISGASSYSSPSVTAGQTVAWRNNDITSHTATRTAAGAFDTGNIAAGATSDTIRFNTAGTFSYFCTIHGAGMMSGTLVVDP